MKHKKKNAESTKLIGIIGVIAFFYLAYRTFPKVLTILWLIGAAYFLIQIFIKDKNKRGLLRVPFFMLFGAYLINRGYIVYSDYSEHIAKYSLDFIIGGLLWLWSVTYIVVYWLSKGTTKERWRSYKKREQSIKDFRVRVSNSLIGKKYLEAEISDNTKLKMIGYVNGCESPPFDFIGCIIKNGQPIPFRLQLPLIIIEIDSVPIVSLCLTHIGFDLKMLSRHRDWSPSYDKTIFPNNEFHGYEFKSKDEYEEIKQEISDGTKKLFIQSVIDGKPLAYCVEVCFWGKEWPYEYHSKDTPSYKLETGTIYSTASNYLYEDSDYRSLFSLCDYLDDAVGSTKLNARVYDYVSNRRINKSIKNRDFSETLAKGLSNLREAEEKVNNDINEWIKKHNIKALSGITFLEEYKKWETEKKNPSFKREILKRILLKNRKFGEEVFAIRNKVIETAKAEARLLDT
ncbi:MAG: hypothetical protein R3D71_03630 [Rickettsiales bacterium]